MYKLIFSFCSLFFIACNNQSETPSDTQGTTTNKAATPLRTALSRESEMEILDECIDNAKGNIGESRAYSLCKCVLNQIQAKHPDADSTALVMHLSDTTEVARMAQQCK